MKKELINNQPMNIKNKFIMSLLLILSAGLFGCSSDEDDGIGISPFLVYSSIEGPDACFTAVVVSHRYPDGVTRECETKLISASDTKVWEEWETSGMTKLPYRFYPRRLEYACNVGDTISFRIQTYQVPYEECIYIKVEPCK